MADEETSTKEFGKNSKGEPVMYDTDVESLQTQYRLTRPEAEDLWRRTVKDGEEADNVADEIVSGRTSYRQTYERVPDVSSAVTAGAVAAREREEADRKAAEEATTSVDRTQPEAGPYGPEADYREATVSAEEVAAQTGADQETVEEVYGDQVSPGEQEQVMTYRSPQQKPGTNYIKAPNKYKGASGGSELHDLDGPAKTNTSDHYPHTKNANRGNENRQGKKIEGFKGRGYVQSGEGIDAPSDSQIHDATKYGGRDRVKTYRDNMNNG